MTSKTTVRPRHWGLGCALAVTVGITIWTARSDLSSDPLAELVQPVTRPGSARSTGVQAPATSQASDIAEQSNWTPRPRAPWRTASGAYYSAWMPPPPPPPTAPLPPPPAPPVAPQFPYQLIGILEEDGQTKALLAGPVRSIAITDGELVDGQWRVDQVSSQGLRLTWLPSKLPQTVAFLPL